MDFSQHALAVIVPAFRVERDIEETLRGLPNFIRYKIVVDDASPDSTFSIISALAQADPHLILLRHEKNQGVGGAMVSGFRKALELGAEVVIKLDGDGQMDSAQISALVQPLLAGQADYAKGNRFRDFEALRAMPFIRRVGNLGLSFLAKAATGYWNIFDPTNGYFAIRAEILAKLPLGEIDRRYFFETSMLSHLYLQDAIVLDVPMPARYRGELSSLSVRRVLLEFPPKLLRVFLRRLWFKYFLYDFSMMSIYLLTGIPLLLFGLVFGVTKWIHYASLNIPAPTGTVMLPTLSVLLAIQILLSAIEIDLNAAPHKPN